MVGSWPENGEVHNYIFTLNGEQMFLVGQIKIHTKTAGNSIDH